MVGEYRSHPVWQKVEKLDKITDIYNELGIDLMSAETVLKPFCSLSDCCSSLRWLVTGNLRTQKRHLHVQKTNYKCFINTYLRSDRIIIDIHNKRFVKLAKDKKLSIHPVRSI